MRSGAWTGIPTAAYLASASSDGRVFIWDTGAGNTGAWEQETVLNGHTDVVRSVAWRPDGAQLASASDDQTVIIWDAEPWRQEGVLTGHTDAVRNVAWHPDGAHLASASDDQTIIVWDTEYLAAGDRLQRI